MVKSVETTGRRGWIALIGGGEDKTRDRDVLSRIVHLNGARSVAIIPSASRVGDEVGEDYDRAFRGLGVARRHVVNVVRSSEAAAPDHLKAIDDADLIFFTGGDQVRLEEGATVAGTSAGAAAAGRRMLFDGDGRGFDKGSIGTADGFGFLDEVSIDTHFVSRGRLPRLTQFLCRGEASAGLGLPEDTAVLVSPDRVASVIGRDVVTALSYHHVERNDYPHVDDSERFTVDGVRLSFLAPGTRFDLRRWRCVPEGTSKAA